MPGEPHVVSDHAEVRAVLADAVFAVPAVPEPDVPGGIAWLRANVSRFSNGEEHRRRRALVTAELGRLDVAGLRRAARERTTALLRGAGGDPLEAMTRIARSVPVDVLAAALGLPAVAANDVADAARAYQPHLASGIEEADRAVARLIDACGGVADEATAARIALLVQACDATAGLVGNSLPALAAPAGSVEEILAATLREDPPVRATRRVATAPARAGSTEIAAGTIVALDLTAGHDEQLPFGSGLRPCPGREHALAIAAGMLEAARD